MKKPSEFENLKKAVGSEEISNATQINYLEEEFEVFKPNFQPS